MHGFRCLTVVLLAPLVTAAAAPAAAQAVAAPEAAALPADPKPGQVVEIMLPDGVPMKFCYCPPGEFLMGVPQTKQEKQQGVGGQVKVRITKGFWLAQTEFTQAQRSALKLRVRGREEAPRTMPDQPSWNHSYVGDADDERSAIGTIGKLAAMVPLPAGWKFSLPTEAQWEYACRAGTTTFFHYGDALDGEQANCNGEFPHGTDKKVPKLDALRPVASYAPNAWGLHDMHGNVAEWCLDYYAPTLAGGDDPTGPAEFDGPKPERVTRGGSFASRAIYCGSGMRKNRHEGAHETALGMRVAIVPAAPGK